MKLGTSKLLAHLKEKNQRPSHFAAQIGKSPSTISRILDETNCPDIETANLIKQHTGIDLEDWITEVPKKRVVKAR